MRGKYAGNFYDNSGKTLLNATAATAWKFSLSHPNPKFTILSYKSFVQFDQKNY